MPRIVVVPAGPASSAANLGQKYARETRSEADIVLAGESPLPPGAWRLAYRAPGPEAACPAAALARVVSEGGYELVLFDDSSFGREAAARIAVRAGLPVIAQVVAIRAGREAPSIVRIAANGTRSASLAPCASPAILVVSSTVGGAEGAAGTVRESAAIHPGGDLSRALDVIAEARPHPSELDVTEADVVVAGGRGAGGREGFAMLEELAGLLGGTVGASRVAVDAGWIAYSRQVGLTGKTVAPRVYIACGISGAPHHVLGMRNSSLIVAINSDPQAPIFRIAHVSVVGRVEDVVPQLITELRGRREARATDARVLVR
ncbi:MAG: electron transfer flavoprotein subunit alpha [Dehalococcoidia bacterium]|mgnify:CR=1 FL=1|nr:electron transfer flavoprotein subunit alpha/FixB family protein [Tepidiformaceae bacterium]